MGIPAGLTNERRKEVYRRDGYVCAICGNHQYLQIHHVVPRGEGGSDFPENLITLCSKCHAQAHGIDEIPGICDRDTVEQACVEYLSDYYVGLTGDPWYPYK